MSRGPLVVVGLVLLALAGGCSDEQHPSAGSRTAGTPPLYDADPAPPAGTRWVGIGDVVLAVPDAWPTETSPCFGGHDRTVLFHSRGSAFVDCATPPNTRTAVVFTHPGSQLLGRRAHDDDLGHEVDGVMVRSERRCWSRPEPYCRQDMIVGPRGRLTAVVLARGTRTKAGQHLDRITGSLTRLPDGLSTVPFLDIDHSLAEAEQIFDRAGLVLEAPAGRLFGMDNVSDPPPGTVVAEGSTVSVTAAR